ncbi:hypothetical protein [Nostoc sp.]
MAISPTVIRLPAIRGFPPLTPGTYHAVFWKKAMPAAGCANALWL